MVAGQSPEQDGARVTSRIPLVSIGMPVHNGERFLSQALDSLLAQRHQDYELIISDNASTDATADICHGYTARESRIRYLRLEAHRDAVGNFDHVLQAARGEYFMWAAADDLWEPLFISTLVDLLRSRADLVLAFSVFDVVDETEARIRTYRRLRETASPDRFRRLSNYLLQDDALGKANLIYGLMRRQAILAAGGFRAWSAGVWGADMLVVFRLLSYGNLALTDDLLFHKRLAIDAKEPPRRGIVEVARRHARGARAWYGYFAGYAHLIRIDEYLTALQKLLLQALLVRRILSVGGAELQRHVLARPQAGAPTDSEHDAAGI